MDIREKFKRVSKEDDRNLFMMHHPHMHPFDIEEKISARASLNNLLYTEWKDEQLQRFEIEQRYGVCKYGKDEKLEMWPHYSNGPSCFFTGGSHPESFLRSGDRECVTYENPENSEHEHTIQYYIGETHETVKTYIEKIKGWEGENQEYIAQSKKNSAAQNFANKKAEPDTAKWYERYYSSLLNKPIQINRILTWIDSRGYPESKILYSNKDVSEVYEN